MKEDQIIELDNKELPIDKHKNNKLGIEDKYKGGFVNLLFLGSILTTSILWIMLLVFLGSR